MIFLKSRKIIFILLMLIEVNFICNFDLLAMGLENIDFQDKCDSKYLKLNVEINPNTTIFAFDLHDVLFARSYKKIAKDTFIMVKNGLFWHLLNPVFLFRAIVLWSENRISEDVFYSLAKYYPGLLAYENDFFNIANSCCYPIEPMIEIVKNLKSLGYKVFLLSNIGCETYSNFKTRFLDIMNLFDGFYIPGKNNNYHYKPSEEYYRGFMDYLRQIGLADRQIIFIDDLPKNLEGALKVGIYGIHCKDTNCVKNVLKKLSVIS